jgi:AraC-like DNA-binding protein
MKAILERIEHQAGECFSCFAWSAQTFVCPYHVHPEIEINYIVGSTGHRLVGDCLGHFKPGDLVLLGAGLPHMYFHKAPVKAPKNWAQSWYIQFLPDCFGRGFFDLPGMAPLRGLMQRSRRGLIFPRAVVSQALPLIRDTFHNTGARRIASLIQLLQVLAEARGVKPLASVQFELPQPPQSSQRLARATAYIHRHISERLTLAATARQAGMSPQGFSRFFHKWMGRTFAAYVTELRIGSACQMLLESGGSIAEVCFASGFRNLSNFNRRFRVHKGMSPRTFRQVCIPRETCSPGAVVERRTQRP